MKRDISSFLADQMAKAKHDDPPTASPVDAEDSAREKIHQQALKALQHSKAEKQQIHPAEGHHELHLGNLSSQLKNKNADKHTSGSVNRHSQAFPAAKASTAVSAVSVPATPSPISEEAAEQSSAAQPSHVESVPHLHGEMTSLKNSDLIEDIPLAHSNATKSV